MTRPQTAYFVTRDAYTLAEFEIEIDTVPFPEAGGDLLCLRATIGGTEYHGLPMTEYDLERSLVELQGRLRIGIMLMSGDPDPEALIIAIPVTRPAPDGRLHGILLGGYSLEGARAANLVELIQLGPRALESLLDAKLEVSMETEIGFDTGAH